MTTARLRTQDVQELVALASEVRRIADPMERRIARMQAMNTFLDADVTGLNLVNLSGDTAILHTEPDVFAHPTEVLRGVLSTHPLIAHYMAPGADMPYRLSDVPGGRTLHDIRGTPLHETMLKQIGLRQIAIPIFVDRPRGGVAYTLNRAGADFTDRERDRAVGLQLVLAAMRVELPNVREIADDDVPALPVSTPLTRRQWEVLYLLVQGREVDDVARILTVSPLTVLTHRRDAYARISAHSLRQAAIHVHSALSDSPSFEHRLMEEFSR